MGRLVRSPKIKPRAGDVLSRYGGTKTVLWLEDLYGKKLTSGCRIKRVVYMTGSGVQGKMAIKEWWSWAAEAEVVSG